MERPSKIQQVYAYAVCLVAVITTLVTLPGMLDALVRRQAPFQSDRFFNGEIAESFEGHKISDPGYRYVQRAGSFGEQAVYDTISEEQARQRYEYKRAERLANVRSETSRALLTDAVLLAVAFTLVTGDPHHRA